MIKIHLEFFLDHSCEYEPHIENAELLTKRKNRYKPGDVVSYRCTGSLKLYGKSDIICINKTWTDLPECKGKALYVILKINEQKF